MPCDALIVRREPASCVTDKDHDVGFGNRCFGLSGHLPHDAFASYRFKAARIDNDISAGPDLTLTVLTVTRKARKIRHDRVTRSGEAVKKRGFTDVGPSDKCYDWKHHVTRLCFCFVLFGKRQRGNFAIGRLHEHAAFAQRQGRHIHGAGDRGAATISPVAWSRA